MNPSAKLEAERKKKMDREKDLQEMKEKLKQLRQQQKSSYKSSDILKNIDKFWKNKVNVEEKTPNQKIEGNRPKPNLTMTDVISIANIPPTNKETKTKTIMYSHGSQTKSIDDILAELKPEIKEEEAIPNVEEKSPVTPKEEIKKDSEEIKQEKVKKVVVNEQNLAQFLNRSSKIILNAISYPDPFVNYFENTNTSKQDDHIFNFVHQFECEETQKRSVLCIDYSPHHPEIFLAGYSKSNSKKDAIVVIWSMYQPKEPIKILRYAKFEDITSAIFYKYKPNVVLGGTSQGKLLNWNLKGKSEPVHVSPITRYIHTHAVGTIAVLGTENVHDIYSMSTCGLVRVFESIQFKEINQHINFFNKNNEVQHPITAQVSAFSDLNRFFIGSESGKLYSTQRYGELAGEYESYENGHTSMITSIHIHPKHNDLLLTSSLDWKVCLWRVNQHEEPIATFLGGQHAIHHVSWHPQYPSVFATVDGAGNVYLWHIDISPDSPLEVFPVTTLSNEGILSASSTLLKNTSPLFSLRWSKNGDHLIVGGEGGLYQLTLEHDSIPSPTSCNWINSGLNSSDTSRSNTDSDMSMMNPEIQYHLSNF